MANRTAEEGRFRPPPEWPSWNKKCGATRRNGQTCQNWAIVGMPTCKFHGSGGEKNRQLGELRYLAWVVTGGPKNMPVEHACRLALAVFAEIVFKNGDANANQRYKAAMWLVDKL